MENKEPQFEILHMPPENTNSVLVSVKNKCVIFDPWGQAQDWEKLLSERNLELVAIYCTHGHSDHISAAPLLAKAHNVPWYLNDGDKDLIMWSNALLEFFQIPIIKQDYKQPENLHEGNKEILDGIQMQIISTPGHSAGGMTFWFPKFDILFVGDTLFQDSFGRYDFPTGDLCALKKSIAKIYDMNLPDQTYVVHGHGPDSTIAMLKEKNPYFVSHDCCQGHCCCHNHN